MQRKSGPNPPKKSKPFVVSSPLVTPPKGHPFAGATGLNAPAKTTRTKDLTAKVAVAKEKQSELTHGGLAPADQRKAASDAARVLNAHKQAKRAAAPKTQTPAHTSGAGVQRGPATSRRTGTPPSVATPSTTKLPAWLTAPAVASPVTSRALPPASSPPSQRQGALGLFKGSGPTTGHGFLRDAVSTGLGTALEGAASIPSTLLTPIHPGATHTAAQDVKPTHLAPAIVDTTQRLAAAGNKAASGVQNAGLSLPKTIPSVDLVAPAGAASTTMTPEKLVAAGLSEAQTKKFRALAKKNGWYDGEINGLVGTDLIKHAYNKAPSGILGTAQRTAQNFGAGLIRTAGLANVPVAIGQEVASGHGLRAVKEIGNAAAAQFGGMLSNPGQAFVSDPYTFIPTAGGALKTLGEVGRIGGRATAERLVASASRPGEVINRGARSKNLYTASGQLISDFATSRSKTLSRKAEAQSVDNLVRDVANGTAGPHHDVQKAFADAYKKEGAKRAPLLVAFNMAGGKPEAILAKYTADGNKRQVAFWSSVVDATRNLSEKDHAFLAAHAAMADHTSQTHVELGRFGDTASVYRAHQPLIHSAAHAGDPTAQRLIALHDEWTKTLRTTEDPAVLAPLHGAYDQATRDFAQSHLDSGGNTPSYVAYTPPPSRGVMKPTYQAGTGGKVRFNARVPGQKASTGGSFESGNYLIDPKVALRENVQAQRLRTSVGLTSPESLKKIGAIEAAKGDARPEGYVFTPGLNRATIGKVMTDLHDKPVSAHDYYHQEADARGRLAKTLEATKGTGEHAAEKGYFVPEGAFNRILDYTRPESRHSYDQFMRQYQRTMISLFPSTALGNTVGSVPLALAAGAGPQSLRMAGRSSRDASLVPFTAHGRGVAGSLASDARNPFTQYMGAMRSVSVKGEDYSRDASYFAHLLPGAAKRAKAHGYESRDAYLRDVATGKVDVHLRDQALDHMIKFAGDAAKPATKTQQKLGRFILFPQWQQHVATLMLKTLPIEHPRRMALVNALAQYGDTYRKEHGAWPSWMTDFIPLFEHTLNGNQFSRVVGLGQLAPQGTAGQTFDSLANGYGSIPERVASILNPPVGAIANTAIQAIKNQGSYQPVDLGRFFANQAAYTIPGLSKVAPRTGMAPDSIPFISERRRTYTDGSHKSTYNPDNSVAWDQRPGARPLGGLLGIASRVAGLPLYDTPNAGSINDLANKKAEARVNKKKSGYSGYAKKKK